MEHNSDCYRLQSESEIAGAHFRLIKINPAVTKPSAKIKVHPASSDRISQPKPTDKTGDKKLNEATEAAS